MSNSKLPTKQNESEMSFFEHLDELRSHLKRAALLTLVIAVVVFVMGDFIFKHFILAPTGGKFLSYRAICWLSETVGLADRLCMVPPDFTFDTRQMGETFFVHIRTSIILALAAAFPFIFREIWMFVKPGLLDNEAKSAKGVVGVASALFMAGVLFGYFIVTPFAVKFLVGYELAGITNNTPTLESYVNYVLIFMIPTGIVFQLPLVVYYLAKIGLISDEFMKTYRRQAFLFIIILAAIITPPDVVTQFLIAVPIYGLYEASISIARKQYAKYQKSVNG